MWTVQFAKSPEQTQMLQCRETPGPSPGLLFSITTGIEVDISHASALPVYEGQSLVPGFQEITVPLFMDGLY